MQQPSSPLNDHVSCVYRVMEELLAFQALNDRNRLYETASLVFHSPRCNGEMAVMDELRVVLC